MGAGTAGIDQEVAVFFRYLGPAYHQAATAGGINFLPRLAARRIGKGAATGAHTARLCIAAAGNDLFHPRLDGGLVPGNGAEGGMGEDPVRRRIAVAIGHAHLVRGGADGLARPVNPVGADGDIAEFGPIGPGIHPQPAPNGARDADQEFQPGKTGTRGMARHIGIRGPGFGSDLVPVMVDRGHELVHPDDNPGNPAIAHQQI